MDYTCNPRTGKAEVEDHYFRDSVEREESGGKDRAVGDGKKKSLKEKKVNGLELPCVGKSICLTFQKRTHSSCLWVRDTAITAIHTHVVPACRPSVAVWTVLCHQ